LTSIKNWKKRQKGHPIKSLFFRSHCDMSGGSPARHTRRRMRTTRIILPAAYLSHSCKNV
jgi:hypothetical protein